jgi:hypothetical protein
VRALAALLLLVPVLGGAQVARPDVKVGDTWTYRRMDYDAGQPRGLYVMRVVFAARGVIQVVNIYGKKEGEVDTTYTADWNAVTTPGRVFNPHTGWFKFPLRVGDTYQASFEAIQPRKEASSRNQRDVKVEGWEEIEVPAGKFRALKVVSEGYFQRIDNTFVAGTSRNVIWYVPEVKRWAKITLEIRPQGGRSRAGEFTGEELLGYKVQ